MGKSLEYLEYLRARVHACQIDLRFVGLCEELMKRFKPKSITSAILCERDDAVLRPLLTQFPNVNVVVIEQFDLPKLRATQGVTATKTASTGG